MTFKPISIVIVTGLSGSGHSTFLNLLEDIGFEATDNLPVSLIPALLETRQKNGGKIAIGIDSRTTDIQDAACLKLLQSLQENPNYKMHLIFLECNETVLERRFKTTRRTHPLAKNAAINHAIKAERTLLAPLAAMANITIDTSPLSPWQLKHILLGYLEGNTHKIRLPLLHLVSFSYKNGIPAEADLVFDVRFLKNPYYEEHLRDGTGLQPAVADYVKKDTTFPALWEKLTALLEIILAGYREEGKSYACIAIGCTGGKHRSVTLIEALQTWLAETGWFTTVQHREIGK